MDASLFKYRIRLFGGKTETNGADQIFFYPTSSDWHVSTVSWNNKPAINYRSDAVLYLNHSHEYRMVDVDKAVRKALAEGKTEISCISAATVREITTISRQRTQNRAWC